MEQNEMPSTDDAYLQPMSNGHLQKPPRGPEQDSGIGDFDVNVNINQSFAQSPTTPPVAELETSFSEELAQPTSGHMLNLMPQSSTFPSFQAPPGTVWMPVPAGQAMINAAGTPGRSGNGIVYPWHPYYPHPYTQHSMSPPSSLEQHQKHEQKPKQTIHKGPSQDLPVPKPPVNVRESVLSGGHLYEELPGYKQHYPNTRLAQTNGEFTPPVPPLSRMPSGTHASTSSGLNSNHNISSESLPESTIMRRENPLYDRSHSTADILLPPVSQSTAADNTQLYKGKQSYADQKWRRLCCIGFVVVAIIALTGLLITILSTTKVVDFQSGPSTSALTDSGENVVISELTKQVQELQQAMQRMQEESQRLVGQVELANEQSQALARQLNATNQIISTVYDLQSDLDLFDNRTAGKFTNIEEFVSILKADLNSTRENVYSTFDLLNNTFLLAIDNVTKMEGPPGVQGPRGAIDPSLCKYKFDRSVFNDVIPNRTTEFVPKDDDLSNYTLIAASCTSVNFYDSKLLSQGENGQKRYQCVCSNQISTEIPPGKTVVHSECYLHYWMCPKVEGT